jgi:electron transfer flavoprotein beta subunit
MRVFVCIKQVPDTETRIKINSEKNGIDLQGLKWSTNPYDDYAIEEAVRLKESGAATQVTVITLGPKSRTATMLRTALAVGADDAISIDAPEYVDALSTAKAISTAIEREGSFAFILTGKLAIDDNLSAVSQMIAEYLKIPHVLNVTKLEKQGEVWVAEREMEGGSKEVFEFTSPVLIGASKGLNKPRFASLPNIVKAKSKPLREIALSDLGISVDNFKVKFSQFELPKEKSSCVMLQGTPEEQAKSLVRALREDQKVL